MKQGSNSRRSRGRGNGKRPQKNHNFDSAGPEGRVRGNAQQVYEKYIALARDAQSAGDRIATENYFQHAEHYLRVLMAQDNGDGRMEAFRQRQQRLSAFGDEFDGEEGEGDDFGAGGPQNYQQNNQQGRPQQNQGNSQGEGRQDNQNRHEGRDNQNRNEGRDNRQEGRQERSDNNRNDNRHEGRQEGRERQEGRDSRGDGRGEGRRDRNENRNRNSGEGRGENRGEGEQRDRNEGRNEGRRVPIERGNDANRAASDDEPDDDGLRRTLAI
jgi:hypothetical protein